MRRDIKSNAIIQQGLIATSYAVAAHNSASFDFNKSPIATFIVNVDVGAAGTVACKLQHSPDNTNWTDETDDYFNNDATIEQIVADGIYQLDVVKPRTGTRYYRVVATVAVNAVEMSISIVSGQKNNMTRVNP